MGEGRFRCNEPLRMERGGGPAPSPKPSPPRRAGARAGAGNFQTGSEKGSGELGLASWLDGRAGMLQYAYMINAPVSRRSSRDGSRGVAHCGIAGALSLAPPPLLPARSRSFASAKAGRGSPPPASGGEFEVVDVSAQSGGPPSARRRLHYAFPAASKRPRMLPFVAKTCPKLAKRRHVWAKAARSPPVGKLPTRWTTVHPAASAAPHTSRTFSYTPWSKENSTVLPSGSLTKQT